MKKSNEKKEKTLHYPVYSDTYSHKKRAYLDMKAVTKEKKRTLFFPGYYEEDTMISDVLGCPTVVYNCMMKEG